MPKQGARTLTPERLNSLLDYNPETGLLTWKMRTTQNWDFVSFNQMNAVARWNENFAHKRAGTNKPNGTVVVKMDGKVHQSTKLIWLMVYGHPPIGRIIHINGNRSDNRLANLKEETLEDALTYLSMEQSAKVSSSPQGN